jgi:hypothetical protein
MGRNPNELDQDALPIPRGGRSSVPARLTRGGWRYTMVATFGLVLDIMTAIELAGRSSIDLFQVVSTIGLITISVALCTLSVFLRRPALKYATAVIGGALAIWASKIGWPV